MERLWDIVLISFIKDGNENSRNKREPTQGNLGDVCLDPHGGEHKHLKAVITIHQTQIIMT
jgi:hypothetical protein